MTLALWIVVCLAGAGALTLALCGVAAALHADRQAERAHVREWRDEELRVAERDSGLRVADRWEAAIEHAQGAYERGEIDVAELERRVEHFLREEGSESWLPDWLLLAKLSPAHEQMAVERVRAEARTRTPISLLSSGTPE